MDISCVIIDDEPHAIVELAEVITHTPGIYMTGAFECVETALDFLKKKGNVDVIFSDINMTALDGISAAKLLHPYCNYLIYVTGYREYAIDAFGARAFGYLLKPVSQQALIDKVNDILEDKNKNRSLQRETPIFIKGGQKNSFVRVETNEIIYIEALQNYISIQTINDKHITHMTLTAAQQFLKSQPNFQRISRFVIVNINHIKSVDEDVITMHGDHTCVIKKSYKKQFNEFMKKYALSL